MKLFNVAAVVISMSVSAMTFAQIENETTKYSIKLNQVVVNSDTLDSVDDITTVGFASSSMIDNNFFIEGQIDKSISKANGEDQPDWENAEFDLINFGIFAGYLSNSTGRKFTRARVGLAHSRINLSHKEVSWLKETESSTDLAVGFASGIYLLDGSSFSLEFNAYGDKLFSFGATYSF